MPTKLGIALVEGYDAMGLAMSQPALRAKMEADMNCVSNGTKTKAEVIANVKHEMKGVFELACQNARMLDQSVAKHFDAVGADLSASVIVKAKFSECGVCHQLMDLREQGPDGRRTRFLLCSRCKKSHNAPHTHTLTPHDHRCPYCHFQVCFICGVSLLCVRLRACASHDLESRDRLAPSR